MDFHALRGKFATLMSKSGVSPKAAQELMRHSDIRLTMQTYTNYQFRDVANDLDKLPPNPWTSPTALAATGTEPPTVRPVVVPEKASVTPDNQPASGSDSANLVVPMVVPASSKRTVSRHESCSLTGQTHVTGIKTKNPQFLRGTEGICGSLTAADSEPSVGFEPTTYALRRHLQQVGFSGENGQIASVAGLKAGHEAGELDCEAVSRREDGSGTEVVLPAELVRLLENWPMLPESVRRVVLALVDGSLPKPIEAALLALLESVQ